ncbi:TRAP transporter small permease [uncultured Desulfuromusa sp.]|uniref:TRAP transporter small permease n=1 Tax=uncultured Desulfuromusa sp. TaxID=219183 RepID=UPI002AA8E8D4|nr:TRAP transporter small permease [uncultured Desulfuromusa sp.]
MSDTHPEPQKTSIIEKMNPEAYANTSKMSLFQKINHYSGLIINGIEVSIMVFCVAALAVLLIVNVVARTFFQSLYFADEISMFLVLIITFVGVSYGVRKARHIRMGAFLDAMPPKMEKVFIIAISLISAVVLGIMTWASWKYLLNAFDRGHMSQALRLPKWAFYVIIPAGFGLASIQYLRTIIKNLTEDEPWQSPDQQSEYEDEEIGGV